MSATPEPSEWQRRYHESIAHENAALKEADDLSGAEVAGFEGSLWLPGWFGAIVLAGTSAIAFIRRRGRRK